MSRLSDNPDPINWDLLDRYFAGELTGVSVDKIRHILMRQGDARKMLDAIDEELDGAPNATPSLADVEQSWIALQSQLDTQPINTMQHEAIPNAGRAQSRSHQAEKFFNSGAVNSSQSGNLRYQVFQTFIGRAAVGLLAGMLIFVFGQTLVDDRMAAVPDESTYVYTTSKGERASVVLPDGNTVFLNVATRLEVPHDYSSGNRNLKLFGEAMFRIIHRPSGPFTVIAGPSTTRVLGTEFTVRHYDTDSVAIIAVLDGKVSVGNTVLTAQQQVAVDRNGERASHPADQARFAFTNDVLTLENVSLIDAIADLNRWYNTDIRLANVEIGSLKIVGGFKAGSVTDLISILEMTNNMRVLREGHVLTIYPK